MFSANIYTYETEQSIKTLADQSIKINDIHHFVNRKFEKYNEVHEHINTVPKYQSHYNPRLANPSFKIIDSQPQSYIQCDSVHEQIDRKETNTSASIPNDWAARSQKYIVHELTQNAFFNFNALLKDNYTSRLKYICIRYVHKYIRLLTQK